MSLKILLRKNWESAAERNTESSNCQKDRNVVTKSIPSLQSWNIINIAKIVNT